MLHKVNFTIVLDEQQHQDCLPSALGKNIAHNVRVLSVKMHHFVKANSLVGCVEASLQCLHCILSIMHVNHLYYRQRHSLTTNMYVDICILQLNV